VAPRQKIAVCRSPFFQLIFQHLAKIPVRRLDHKSFKNDFVIFVINQVENVLHNLCFIGKMCFAINAKPGILWVSKIYCFPTEKAPLLKTSKPIAAAKKSENKPK
jgi:hypothetical protein